MTMKLTAVFEASTQRWTVRLAGRELDDTIEAFDLTSMGFVICDDEPGEDARGQEITLIGNLDYD